MNTKSTRTSVTIVLIVSLLLNICGCCSENNNNGRNSLQLSSIYGAALGGALIGGIIGYQSDETGEGVALGATICGVGALLHEMDHAQKHNDWNSNSDNPECTEQVIVDIHNDNGSITPVKLKKKGDSYFGPKGERYDEPPTEEQLKPVYGL